MTPDPGAAPDEVARRAETSAPTDRQAALGVGAAERLAEIDALIEQADGEGWISFCNGGAWEAWARGEGSENSAMAEVEVVLLTGGTS